MNSPQNKESALKACELVTQRFRIKEKKKKPNTTFHYELDAIILIVLSLYASFLMDQNGKGKKPTSNTTCIQPQLSGPTEELGSQPGTQQELLAAKSHTPLCQ